MKIAFIWQGIDGRYGYWRDGLWAALQLLEQDHIVKYFDFPLKGLETFNPDVVLYWEAPCTILGKDKNNYLDVCALPYKKCLLFAGGPIKRGWLTPFDLIFVESRINEEELTEMEIPWKRAFGVNTKIMKPQIVPKVYDACYQATFAEWKRHELFAQALGEKGVVAGRLQEFDRNGYDECVKRKVTIFPELTAYEVATMINSSYSVVNTASFWGGGQRCTLEAMACEVPIIVMQDSPKNLEYVLESGGGLMTSPHPEAIQVAVEQCKQTNGMGILGRKYVESQWTEQHYAMSLLEGIRTII